MKNPSDNRPRVRNIHSRVVHALRSQTINDATGKTIAFRTECDRSYRHDDYLFENWKILPNGNAITCERCRVSMDSSFEYRMLKAYTRVGKLILDEIEAGRGSAYFHERMDMIIRLRELVEASS